MAKKQSGKKIDISKNVQCLLQSEIFLGNIDLLIPGGNEAIKKMIADGPQNKADAKPASKTASKPAAKSFSTDSVTAEKERQLNDFYIQIKDCKNCGLWENRENFVFGEGCANADLMFIGEAPGRDENRQGRPFVGRAGQLLTKMILALGMKREDAYIANICKCWPPDNRAPSPDEGNTCLPYLQKQIEIIEPKIIVLLGATASKYFLQDERPIGRLRGLKIERGSQIVIPTYHPAYLLRNPADKHKVWDDIRNIPKMLEEM